MSGRIRTLKPELLEDAVTAGLSDMAFRLFVSSILLADDHGRLRAEPSWLMGQVLWSRSFQVEDFLAAMAEISLVTEDRPVPLVQFYEVKGQRYAQIRNWSKHQKVSHPAKPRIPPPPGELAKPSGDPPENSENVRPDLRSPTPTTDQGPPTDPPAPEPNEPVKADPSEPEPKWWAPMLSGLEIDTGVTLPAREAWLRYAGHRGDKGGRASKGHATYWLTTVMVAEARRARDEARRIAERDAKFDRSRAGPGSTSVPIVETADERKANAERLAQSISEAKAKLARGAA